MKKILIHIGLPKSGTSFVQKKFQALRSELIHQKILYPESPEGDYVAATGNAEHLIPLVGRLDTLEGIEEFNARLALMGNNENIESVVLSCENLAHLHLSDIRLLLNWACSTYEQVHIIAVRHFLIDDYLRASYAQAVKQTNETRSFASYLVDERRALERSFAAPGVFQDECAGYQNASVMIFCYSENCGADVLDYMLQCSGGNISANDKRLFSRSSISCEPRENQGIPYTLLKYCLVLNRIGIRFLPPERCNEYLSVETERVNAPFQGSKEIGEFSTCSTEEVFLFANLLRHGGQTIDLERNALDEAAAIIQGHLGAGTFRAKSYDNIPEDFDPVIYLLLNIDVMRSRANPFEHYSVYGLREGRQYRLRD